MYIAIAKTGCSTVGTMSIGVHPHIEPLGIPHSSICEGAID